MLSDYIVVESDDLPDAAHLEWLSVFLSECLNDGAQLGEVVAGHGREQVVLQLVLHSTEQILSDEVVAADASGGVELV